MEGHADREPALVVLQRRDVLEQVKGSGHIRSRGGVVAADRFIGLLVQGLQQPFRCIGH